MCQCKIYHEKLDCCTWNDPVRPGAFIPIASLPGFGKLPEVLGRLWDDVLFQLYDDASKWCAIPIPSQAEIKID